jgi:CHAT domain-containing protein
MRSSIHCLCFWFLLVGLVTMAQEPAANNLEQMAVKLNSEGIALSRSGEYDRALASFEKSLQIRRSLNKPLDVAKTLNNIAGMYHNKAQYDRSLAANEESLSIKERLLQQAPQDVELKKSVATSLVNLGLLHKFLGNLPLAVQRYQHGLKLHQEMGNSFESAAALNNLGVAYFEQGFDQRALDHYNQALQQNSAASKADLEQKAQILNNIGQAHLHNKNYAQALEACRESLRLRVPLGNPEKIARTQMHMARIFLAQKSYAEALKFAEDSAQLSQQKLPENYWSARSIAGQALLHQNELKTAAEAFTEAIAVIENLRTKAAISPEIQQRFFENKVTPYLAMVDIFVAQNRPTEALAYAERTKARVLLELLTSRSNESVAASAINAAQAITMAETEALLPDAKTALLEFIIAEEKVYLFVLHRPTARTSPELRVFPLALTKTQLTEQVTRFRREVAERKLGFTASATALQQQLLNPAQAMLTGKTSLVIVPDGVLWELPFQALMNAKGRYLLEDHTIAYAPSLTALREISKRNPARATAPQSLLAFGNPSLTPTDQLPALPKAEAQVRELGALFGAANSKVYLGAEASEQRFKAEAANYGIINLAAHGIFDDQQPMASRILLAQSGSDDGRLEAHEIMQLPLKAELVVLSACETARGYIGPGEGVIGLTWAFLNAGAPAVVVSQWQVREDSTAALMKNFYQQIKIPSANLTRANALRQAALSVMQNDRYRHPFYWAGFVLIGRGN